MKVCARYLMPGDVTGSGETVVKTSAGISTPRGKIEVVLERDGKRHLAIWGAGTTINVKRMEHPQDLLHRDGLPQCGRASYRI